MYCNTKQLDSQNALQCGDTANMGELKTIDV